MIGRRTSHYLVPAIALFLPAAVVLGQAGEPLPPTPDPRPLTPEIVRYDGHMVVRAEIRNLRDLRAMLSLSPDVWSHRVGIGPVDFRIPPEAREALNLSGVPYAVLIEDMQPVIEQQQANRQADNFFDAYRTKEEVYDFMDSLVAQRPDLIEKFHVGKSIEERDIWGYRITGAAPRPFKRAVLYNGGQHSREWISIMASVFFADQLVQGYGVDPEIIELMDDLEFILVPLVNPDGYLWTWDGDRMWRKNRRGDGQTVWGVDLNRNWGYRWGGQGSSGNRNSQTYRGTAPFSEPETAALRDVFFANPHIAAHVDIHNYSQLVLQPWGWTTDLPPDHTMLHYLGGIMAGAMQDLYGQRYIHGPGSQILYLVSGGMRDWTYGELGMPGFTYELRPRGANPGFLLPPDQIVPASEECMVGLIELAQWTRGRSIHLDVGTLVGGQLGHFDVNRALPETMTYLVYSLDGPWRTFVPALNVTLGLRNPVLAGPGVLTDANGRTSWLLQIPPRASGARVWFQAVQDRTGSVVVETRID